MRIIMLSLGIILSFGVVAQKNCKTSDCAEKQLMNLELTDNQEVFTEGNGTFKIVSNDGRTPAFTQQFVTKVDEIREDYRTEVTMGSYLVIIAGRNEINELGHGPFMSSK